MSTAIVKCVVWDIDHTLLDGVYLESPDEPPAAYPAAGPLLAQLGELRRARHRLRLRRR